MVDNLPKLLKSSLSPDRKLPQITDQEHKSIESNKVDQTQMLALPYESGHSESSNSLN